MPGNRLSQQVDQPQGVAPLGLFALHLGEFSRMDDAEIALDMVTTNPATIMGLGGNGISEGHRAHFNVLAASTAYEAFRTNANRRFVIRHGRVVAQTRTETTLEID